MKKYYLFALIPLLFMVSGCEERYRYPCQNPENWDHQYCKKPYCSANGTCPEDLKHYEKEKTDPKSREINLNNKGACK